MDTVSRKSPYGNRIQKKRLPFSISGSPNEEPIPFQETILKSIPSDGPFPYGDGSVTNLFQNRVCDCLGINKKIPKWKCVPIWIHCFHMAIPVCKHAGRFKNTHMGNPHFKIEFVTIWGLTCMLMHIMFICFQIAFSCEVFFFQDRNLKLPG